MRYLLVVIVAVLFVSSVYAQVSLKINFNVDRQPLWGPTGYDHVEYYYLPDIEAYYNVPQQRFYYYEGGRWIGRSRLPSRYRDFDFYNSYKVVVNDRNPYRNHVTYRDRYASYKGRHDQQAIRDSRESRYFANKDHPEHSRWVKQQRDEKINHDRINRGNKNGKKHHQDKPGNNGNKGK
jgi:hypothetical protein